MEIGKVRVTAGSNVINLPMYGALPTDSYICWGIDGLGPPPIDVSIKRTLHQGGVFQNSIPELKEVVIQIGLNPNWSAGQKASNLREMIYGTLTGGYSGNQISVILLDELDVELGRVNGHVKNLETIPFSKDPKVQLTVSCVDSYFTGPADVHPTLGTLNKTNPVITNLGSAPSGIFMEIDFTANVTNWHIQNELAEKFRFVYSFLTGDNLLFSTVPGNRYARVVRGIDTFNMLPYLEVPTKWHQLHQGVNTFQTSSASFNWVDVYYRPKFWGP